MNCLRCGNELHGRQERFCSDPCRKRHHESQPGGVCSDCGAPISRAATYGKLGTRCADCFRVARRRAWETRALIIGDMWADGMTGREIADALGWSLSQFAVETARIREWRPEMLPYRRSPQAVANMKASRAAARARRAAA